MTDALARLRKLADAATQVPWQVDELTVFNPGECYVEVTNDASPEDAALIAAMRNALPLLLDLVEKADRMRRAGTYVPPEYGTGPTEEAADYDDARKALEKVGTG